MKKILLICDDFISSKMAGPGQRYIELAHALSKNYSVYLLADFEKGYVPPKGINIINPTISFSCNPLGIKTIIPNPAIKKIINQYAVVITQGCLLQSFNWLRKVKKPLILDLYCPWFFEDLESRRTKGINPAHKMLHPILKMLHYGDFFVCANEKQRDFYLALLLLNNRIKSNNYGQDPSLRNLIDIVPAGISSISPKHVKSVLKGVLPGINQDDKVILWFGGLWDWVDPLTAVKALELITKKRNDIKLVFIGIKHPSPNGIFPKNTNKTIELAKKLNLYNKFIFFIDWVPYDERGNYLLESDIGIVNHINTLETHFAWRTKVLDFFWADLPTVATAGDSMADIIKEKHLGMVIPPQSPEAQAEAILNLLDSKEEYAQIKANIARFKPSLYWEKVIQPIEQYIAALK